jgi:hypothetical protein
VTEPFKLKAGGTYVYEYPDKSEVSMKPGKPGKMLVTIKTSLTPVPSQYTGIDAAPPRKS